ncbi:MULTISPECIES: hypothetical protein [unclassified Dermacoccus]|uniref:hypothetical protein n=1 Tax=unclassified Dermacoccus TaxID=2643059 RepID=UPI00164E1163|nr:MULTISPECIES: hypothetical protein [unclassified Dermacoccus]MBZ4497532.1 hypothetical protein [Dermacoccus sp. Tok2021]QNK51973.1 hypothetical protein H7F30_09980 [Dermacoccus sp. PAMC28757]
MNTPPIAVRSPGLAAAPTLSPDAVLAWFDTRASLNERWLFTLDGRSGAGKTQLSDRLAQHYPHAQVLHLDDLYRDWDSLPSGVLRARQLVEHWRAGRSPSYKPTQWAGMPPREREPIHATRSLIVEGVGAGWVGQNIAEGSAWLEASREQRRIRALRRDGEMFAPYWVSWEAQERSWFTAHPPRADVVVDASDLTDEERSAAH